MELDPIEQEFVANVSRYLAGLEEMDAAGNEFVASNEESIASIFALQQAINSLESKTISVHTEFSGYSGDSMQKIIGEAESASGVMQRFFTVGEEGVAVERSLDDTIRDASNSIFAEAEATRKLSAARNELNDAARQVGLSDAEMGRLARASGDALFQQGNEAANKADKLYELIEAHNVWTDTEAGTLWIPKEMAQMMGLSAQETEKAATAAAHAGRTFAIWGTGVRLTGYGLHWLIAGTSEFLAVLIPAMIAAGAAAGAMTEGVVWATDRLKATFAATEATSSMIGKTTGQVLGLKDSLQQAQAVADPGVWELVGAAVSGAKEQFGNFWAEGDKVVQMLDRFAAHVDISLGPGGVLGGQAQMAIKGMVGDLQGLGQVVGNVAHLLLGIGTDMPGVAEMILHLLAGITGFLSAMASNKFIAPLFTAFMVVEEIGRWGGLLFNMFGPVTTAIGTAIGKIGIWAADIKIAGMSLAGVEAAGVEAGAAIEGVGAAMGEAGAMSKTFAGAMLMPFTTLPGAIMLTAAAIYILGIRMHMLGASAADAEAPIAKMQQALNADTPTQAFGTIIGQFQQLNQGMKTTAASTNFFVGVWNEVKAGLGAGGETVIVSATAATAQYQAHVKSLISTMADLLSANVTIGKTYYDTSHTIGLATAAGVTMNDMFDKQGHVTAIAKQMITNLISGYQMMAQTGTILANDINAIDVQTLMQQTDVQKLNQAWDSFLSMVTGGTGALGSFNSDLSTMGNVALDATSKITAFGQQSGGTALNVKQISVALESFKGTSAQVWQNYNASISQAGQLTDWLRTAAATGAVAASQYKQAIKGVVSELLPYAAHSKTAASELSVLAQQAGGPATTSYQTLSTWVGNTKVAQDALNGTVNTATQYMSNLSKVAQNLSTTLNSEVDNALAQGAINVKGITGAAEIFTAQLHKGNTNTWAFVGSVAGLVKQLRDAGQPLNDIKSVMDQLAVKAGLSKSQIKQLNSQINNLASALGKIHDVSATVRISEITQVQGSGSGATGPIPSGKSYKPMFAQGGRVHGSGSGDVVPAMLEPGEAVVPKHLVGAISPFLGAHGVPGFAKGGVPGGNGHGVNASPPPGLTPMEIVIREWAKNIWHADHAKFGEHGPIALDTMREIFGPKKFGKTGMWKNPQYVRLITDEQADMRGYYLKDIAYWGKESDIKSIGKSEKKQIAIWEKDIRTHYGAATEAKRMAQFKEEITRYEAKLKAEKDPYWQKIYRKDIARVEAELKAEPNFYKNKFLADIANLRKIDASKIHKDQKVMAMLLEEMGYAKGGLIPYGMYDKGGYLPTGLSLAMNNTGSPEPVGPAAGGVTHVHIEVGGQEIANAMLPSLVGSANRYSYRNSGKATGILRPS